MEHAALRQELVETARRMNRLGINQGTSGNVSVRAGDDTLLLTPSAVTYETMGPEDVVEMRFDGSWRCPAEGRRPTTEWRFHRDILSSLPEVGAVVHTHAVFSTALSCLRLEIPAFHYMVALAGGDSIRCANYATFGTQELSDHALRALEGRMACLLANHGMLALGATLARALALAVEVETLAEQYCRARQLGEPRLLSREEMARVHKRIAAYGASTDPVAIDGEGDA